MLKSMTGYGRCEETVNGRHITAELKSVNHKYFEFSPRVTRGYGFLEDKLKTYVQSRVARGKIDFYLNIETLEDTDVVVSVNHSLAAGYIAAFRELSERYHLPDHGQFAFALLRYFLRAQGAGGRRSHLGGREAGCRKSGGRVYQNARNRGSAFI